MDNYSIRIHSINGIDALIVDVIKDTVQIERRSVTGREELGAIIDIWWDALVDSEGTPQHYDYGT